MAFSGYLLKVNSASGTQIPMQYMRAESYKATPQQRMEVEAKRDATGVLHRNTVSHTASKIEFETPYMTNREVDALTAIFRNAYTDELERKLTLYYYDPSTGNYQSGEFYMPDSDFPIDHIDLETNTVYYQPIRFAFIEY